MSTRSKSSQPKPNCCIRKGTLTIDTFTLAIEGDTLVDPFGPVHPSGLEGPLNTVPLTITSDASDQCKEKVRKQIVQLMRMMANQAFKAWLQTSPQAGLVTGWSPAFRMIRFIGVGEWDFEMECCDDTQTGGIITDYKTFPAFYGIRLVGDNQFDPTLTWLKPPIVCRP